MRFKQSASSSIIVLAAVSALAACAGSGTGTTPPVSTGAAPQSVAAAPEAATPQPTITPFARSWRIAGEGKINGLDDQFKATNNDFDNRPTQGGEDGDLKAGDPGALPQGGGQGPLGSSIGGISCDSTMSNNYHVHAFVGLYVNGKEIAIPDAIGIVHAGGDVTDPSSGWPNQELYVGTGGCFYHIHTHDPSGMVHLEDPNPNHVSVNGTLFNIGQLFAIWGVHVNSTQFGPFNGPVKVYTSGQFSRANQCFGSVCNEVGSNMYSLWTGGAREIPLYSHEVIWYEVGTGNPDVAHLPGVSFAVRQ